MHLSFPIGTFAMFFKQNEIHSLKNKQNEKNHSNIGTRSHFGLAKLCTTN